MSNHWYQTMLQSLPLIGLALFFSVGFVWRTWLHRRRYGASGFALFRSGHWAQHIRDGLALVLVAVLAGQAVAVAVDPAVLDAVRLIPAYPVAIWSGAALMIGGTVTMAAAQLDLGASWRIGIDADARPGLVTAGIYRFCRNPIFLCMFVVLLGFVLLVPTTLSLVAAAAAFAGVRRQVHEEESYLLRTYGHEYATYAAVVGRFLPGVGRLSRSAGEMV